MKKVFSVVFLLLLVVVPMKAERNRLIVMSDIGGSDPDDQQSLVHLLTTLDGVDLEGFIHQHAWVSFNKGNEVKVVNEVLSAYEKVLPNLQVHGKGFPNVTELRQLIKHGQQEAAMKGVGEGKDSPGSELIIKVVDRDDSRPVWITSWAGMNTLAQALWKVRSTRTPEEVTRFVKKIRVYDVLGQDDAGAWIVTQFPELVYIRSKEVYGWAPSDSWVQQHVQSVGILGKQYPNRIWATEGDSPSFLYVMDNGLNYPEHPDWGGWGGRFDLDKKENVRSMDWVVKSGLDETKYDPYLMLASSAEGIQAILKWKEDIFNNFAARMQWTITDNYTEANHHPIAVVGKDKSTRPLFKKVKCGKIIKLDASRSSDPDGDRLSYQWIYYPEPGTYKGKLHLEEQDDKLVLQIPSDANGSIIHFILRVSDSGTPSLTSYRRIILQCSSK